MNEISSSLVFVNEKTMLDAGGDKATFINVKNCYCKWMDEKSKPGSKLPFSHRIHRFVFF